MIFLYPLYICLSLLWDPVEIRLWRWIFPPVSASLSYPPPPGASWLLGVLSGGDQPPRPSPPTTDGALAFSFSFHARLRARCQGYCPLLPMLLYIWFSVAVFCATLYGLSSQGSRYPPALPLSLSCSSLLLLLDFSHPSTVLKTWVVP